MQPIEEVKSFEDAINNIDIDITHNEESNNESNYQPESEATTEKVPVSKSQDQESKEDYYRPSNLSEGYFSEIEHYVKNKNVDNIVDDVIKKDFLTNMKDYHDTKKQGKPFFIHKEDLREKLEKRMDKLRELEEEWHDLTTNIEKKTTRKNAIEKEIESEGKELKELFIQVKMNRILEQQSHKDHSFKLRNGQELFTLNDLRKALTYMSDEEFCSYVNEQKNDFATWTKEALNNLEVYENIRRLKTKKELEEYLKKPV